ncbi:unnamed protein product [Camellia sinensis]
MAMTPVKLHVAVTLMLLVTVCSKARVFTMEDVEEAAFMYDEMAPSPSPEPATLVAGSGFTPPVSIAAAAFSVMLYVIGVFMH